MIYILLGLGILVFLIAGIIKFRKKKLPHEIFPEIIEWKPGDKISRFEDVRAYRNYKCYCGVTEDKIIISDWDNSDLLRKANMRDRFDVNYRQLEEISPRKARTYRNERLHDRREKGRNILLARELEQNPYNKYLESIRDEHGI